MVIVSNPEQQRFKKCAAPKRAIAKRDGKLKVEIKKYCDLKNRLMKKMNSNDSGDLTLCCFFHVSLGFGTKIETFDIIVIFLAATFDFTFFYHGFLEGHTLFYSLTVLD